MRALILVCLVLWNLPSIAQLLPRRLTLSVKDVPAVSFIQDTLRKYTACRITATIPGLRNRTVTLVASDNTLQQVLQMAFPDIFLRDSTYYQDAECMIAIYADPAAETPLMPPYTVSYPRRPRGIFTLTFPNGFQRLPILTAPSSFAAMDGPGLHRIVNPDITRHFAGVTSGVLLGAGNPINLSIHGRSTIVSANSPLLVWDNFAYFGQVGDINPYDIDSVTVLKDAASAGIWGSFSANTVIVLTSMDGRYRQKPQVTLDLNTTITEKPDVFYRPHMSPDSFISAERQFFDNGYYSDHLKSPSWPFTPAVEIFRKQQAGILSPKDADFQLSQLAGHRLYDDLSKYFYRSSVSRAYHISVNGGDSAQKYYLGLGVDNDPTTLTRNRYTRYTAHGSYTFQPFSPKLEVGVSFNFADVLRLQNDSGSVAVTTPYAAVADTHGSPLPVSYKYSNSYLDTVGGGKLLDWHYRPQQELQLADNRYRHISTYAQANVKYSFLPGWAASVLYRQSRGWSTQRNTYDPDSYYVRDRVNRNTRITRDSVLYGIPPGRMRYINDTSYIGHNLRAQLGYTDPVRSLHRIIALAGFELNDWTTTGSYTDEWTLGNVNPPIVPQPLPSPAFSNTPLASTTTPVPGLTNRYASFFSNFSYTWRQRISFYASYRLDASNDVGADIGNKWSPFWALGVSKQLLKLYDGWGPLWKVRLSYGVNGNVSGRTAALGIQPQPLNIYGQPQSSIIAAPDPARAWEKNYVLNAGTDFELFREARFPRGRLNGSLDVYSKKVTDLVTRDTLSPAAGVASFWGNTAGIKGNGLDLVINSVNKRGRWEWTTNLLLSVARDWVSHTQYEPQSPWTYVEGGYPIVGKPVTGIASYKWAGLDPRTGDPRGWLNGKPSTDFSALQTSSGAGVVSSGATQPQVFGHLLNTFSYRGISLSLGVSYKGAFVLRRPSLDYDAMQQGLSSGNNDYYRRWQRPGDERHTVVPSLSLDNDPNRDAFYTNSEATIIRGDLIRLQDLRLGYVLPLRQCQRLGIRQANFYLYANNLGILWRANGYGIDPDAGFYGGLPAPRSWSIGMQVGF